MILESETFTMLREAGYWTARPALGNESDAMSFEDGAVIGFVHFFPSASQLLAEWSERESSMLIEHAPALRLAGDKAWNVYTVLLTPEMPDPVVEREILSIEENLRLTRKIARAGIVSEEALRAALLPLLPIGSRFAGPADGLEERLRNKVASVLPPDIATAFLGVAPPEFVARLLMEQL